MNPLFRQALPQTINLGSAWRGAQNALGATFVVHLARTAFALSLATSVASFLSEAPWHGATSPRLPAANDALWLLETLRIHWPPLTGQLIFWVGVFVLYLLFVPLLSMFWLCALARPGSLHSSMMEAASRYRPCLLVSALCAAVFVAATAVAFGLPWIVYNALAFLRDQRARDLLTLSATTPGLLLLWATATWHDTSRAALATIQQRPLSALSWGLPVALRPRAMAAFAGWLFCATLLTAAGSLTTTALDGPTRFYTLPPPILILQICALGRTLLRARWLVSAIRMVSY